MIIRHCLSDKCVYRKLSPWFSLNDFLQSLYQDGFTIEEIEDEEVSKDKVNVEPFSVYSVTIPCD